MNNYQIGLMCSRSEGFGLVTAEYMHGQLGVIASDSGANPELINDGRTGLLFKSGDAHDLARCIEKFYSERQLLIQLSKNAREDARERFSSENNANKIFNIYKDILDKKAYVKERRTKKTDS
jgi:glycosyltransferase involved in cell wall biosynthesis